MDIVDFAVNEQCAQFGECAAYSGFLAAGKPVFHIEYPSKAPAVNASERAQDCQSVGVAGMSTVLKELSLSGWVGYCDGSQAVTPTKPGSGGNPWTTRPPPPTTKPHTTTSTKPTTTTKPPTTTSKPTTIKTTTSSKPTTTAPGGGCRSKHWDQCGGTDWKGCTVCEVRAFIIFAIFLLTISTVWLHLQTAISAVVLPMSLISFWWAGGLEAGASFWVSFLRHSKGEKVWFMPVYIEDHLTYIIITRLSKAWKQPANGSEHEYQCLFLRPSTLLPNSCGPRACPATLPYRSLQKLDRKTF